MSYTKSALKRIDSFRKIGCIVSGARQWDVHHLTEGYRLGNEFTIPLSLWHHRGACEEGYTIKQMTEKYGPSLKHNKKDFVAKYGTERELLAKVNELIK